ncbi:hypothetical protein NUW58_g3548 [Xylaria curta]|uniref:Uncharacterized protein n=1 Tax=Xylaria curta TaxID=42375 RepID=A0ACC1PAF6_9PEZI|nr:hypothetical protein NUW58_g3548 [Xylaria curta]
MTVCIQGCVRTACGNEVGEGNLVYGLLTIPGGAWYFGYDVTIEEVQIFWYPLTSLPLDSAAASVLFRLWNVNSTTLQENPDMRVLGVQPVLEQEIDLNEFEDPAYVFKQKLNLEFNEFLVFGFEGTGPALGEQEKTGNDGLSEKLSTMQAELEKARKESREDVSSLQAAFNAERLAKQKAFDAEKARLQVGFEAKEAELQREVQDKTRYLEKALGNATRELEKAKRDKEHVEKLYVARQAVEMTLKEENLQLSQERDEIETKFQKLENETYSLNQDLQDVKTANEKQRGLITALEADNANIRAELANLLQTVVPENKQLKDEISMLQDAVKVVEADLEDEKTKVVEEIARSTRFESTNRSLGQQLRKAKNDLAYSENKRSRLEGENDRATARLEALQAETSKRQEQIQHLTQNLRAEKASHEEAISERDRLQELMLKELSDADRNISDMHLKIAVLEKRAESAIAEKNDLNMANLELKDHLSYEIVERQAAEKSNERLRTEVDELRSLVDAVEEKVSVLESDLSAAKSKLGSYDLILKELRERYAKVLFNLKSEKFKSAEAERRFEALDSITKAKISKLTGDLEGGRAEAKRFSDLCDSTKAELEETKQKQATANFGSEKQARQLKTAIEQTRKLEAELEKAFQRWLKYDKERLYEQLDNEREAHGRCKEALETAKAEHAVDVSRLESEVQRMDGEIKSKDDKIHQQTDSIINLEGKYQWEQGLKAVLEGKVQDLETQVTQLGASLTDERNSRMQFESWYNQEASSHTYTRQSLANETQRANNNGDQLNHTNTQLNYANNQLSQQRNKLSQANSDLEYERNRVVWASSELNDKKNELQQAKITISNNKAKIRTLENSSKHDSCVTKNSVDTVIGSYERLYDFAMRKGSRKGRYTLHKAHYPDGFGRSNGKYFVRFRDEYF